MKLLFVKIYGALAVLIDILLCYRLDLINKPWLILVPIVLLPVTFLLLFACHILVCYVISLFVSKKKEVSRPSKFLRFVLDNTVEVVLLILGYKIFETGKDIIPAKRRFLLVSNHLSAFDPISTILSVADFGVVFVSKPENFKIPAAGGFMHQCGFLSIDRNSPRNSMRTLHKCVDIVKNDIASVCIYPEGHRSETGELQEFKDGVFYVAKKADCPVVVMTVRYEKRKLWGKRVFLDYKAVIEPDTFKEKNTHTLSDEVRDIMLKK
ncbi:MAG: 1-acyl-sn-glycerol-3-phosphate acyltransferase [Ruminococcaceae bacterium]|nr:1-acyl-sn-glycerol-3-phosphate acyltransferase [Oscillospiraceae bacterium]